MIPYDTQIDEFDVLEMNSIDKDYGDEVLSGIYRYLTTGILHEDVKLRRRIHHNSHKYIIIENKDEKILGKKVLINWFQQLYL